MNFKAQVERDLTAVFHNAREHADVMEFWIDGVRYKGPVIIDDGGAQDRKKPSTDHVDGLVLVDLVVYVPLYRLEEFMRSYYFTRKANAERERRAAGLPPPGPEEVRHYSDGWVLKCDISKYFYSIQHEPLKQMTRKYIKDPDILWLVDLIVDSTENPGIPIGNQTSQWFAVMYLSGMDHFIKEKLGIRYYGRYMDDFYLIHEDKAYLQYCRGEIEQYVARLGLRMNKKTNIFPLRNGIDFLGFRTYLTESGKIIRKVRRSSKCNAQRKLKKQRGLLDREKISLSDIEQSYGSWRSHAVKGNCYHLIQKTDSLFQNLFKESEKQWPKV